MKIPISKLIFLYESYCILISISQKFGRKGPISNASRFVKVNFVTEKPTSHYLNQWWPISRKHDSNSMEVTFYSRLDCNIVIATKFCTWHDSCSVVASAKHWNIVAIWWTVMELQQGEFSIEFECWAKYHLWYGPQSTILSTGYMLKYNRFCHFRMCKIGWQMYRVGSGDRDNAFTILFELCRPDHINNVTC